MFKTILQEKETKEKKPDGTFDIVIERKIVKVPVECPEITEPFFAPQRTMRKAKFWVSINSNVQPKGVYVWYPIEEKDKEISDIIKKEGRKISFASFKSPEVIEEIENLHVCISRLQEELETAQKALAKKEEEANRLRGILDAQN